jgi:glyoxylase-like metal-dependent hydrolase (beta-lactamase superfamily II)
MSDLPPIEQFISSTGTRIYRLPMIVFPNGFVAYAYLVLGAGVPTLVDTGSGFGRSTPDLLAGIAAIPEMFGESIRVQDIERVFITHGHIDHFGGLDSILTAAEGALVGVHALDRRVLTNYEERVSVATKNLTIYLQRAGVSADRMPQLLEMYGFSKQHFRSVQVDFLLDEGAPLDGMEFYHVPGHCSGQVAIRIGDVLLSADHILPVTSPHLAAESITHYTGVGHYEESLRKLAAVPGIRVTLGGHEGPIHDLYGRIGQIQERLKAKKERVLDFIRSADHPMTISDVSKVMFPDKHGFDVLLALQEAGAYVEYLYERGYLDVTNLAEFEADDKAALCYSVL